MPSRDGRVMTWSKCQARLFKTLIEALGRPLEVEWENSMPLGWPFALDLISRGRYLQT